MATKILSTSTIRRQASDHVMKSLALWIWTVCGKMVKNRLLILLMELKFTREEVIQAIKEMHPVKAPRKDGLSALLCRKY
ncbi:conserved hypothetical protein [Ricinus communis]|uniref:Uncharacterized protein n=1 Tax=Ricinus communis TaxID=3988 RepID=B9T0Y8_RICCO|nr:conserved hypothetical protein [Ricinus communis]